MKTTVAGVAFAVLAASTFSFQSHAAAETLENREEFT
jgi:hypothetical protein